MVLRQGTGNATSLDAFNYFEDNNANGGPKWIQGLRREAISRFNTLGFPTARRGNEEWKYTDIGPIAKLPFQPNSLDTPIKLSKYDLGLYTLGEASWHRLVFVDGAFQDRLSTLSSVPTDLTILNLEKAIETHESAVQHHLARYADSSNHAFTALNTACLRDGAFVSIDKGALVEKPIHLIFLTSSEKEDITYHPRILVLAGEDSHATLIESYGSLRDGQIFCNAVSEVLLEPGASLQHYRVQRHSQKAFHVGTNHVKLGNDSTFTSVTMDLGGKLVRNNLNVLMEGPGSSCMLNGVYLVTDSQHVDNQVIIDHAAPRTTSREVYKGILNDKSRAVFHGGIIVREGAQQVDSKQENKNLLLSNEAEADTKPAFWIYADDVKCGHGAASGKLDEDALFYLRSRGLPEHEARMLLMKGFVSEVISTIPNKSLQSHIEEMVDIKLQQIWSCPLEEGTKC